MNQSLKKTQRNQETQGLLSPWIRDVRLRHVGRCVAENEVVLDLACGAGLLADHLPRTCKYFGVDRIQFAQSGWETARGATERAFLVDDLLADGAVERIAAWLPEPPTVITMVAFLEHIEDPAVVVSGYATLLTPNGKVVGTTPHPMGRSVHDLLSSIGLCSRDAAEEHHDFLNRNALQQLACSVNADLARYRRFLGRLNQLFVFKF